MELEGNKIETSAIQEEKIDLVAIFNKLWQQRRLYAYAFAIAFVVGIIIAFSIPKTYKAEVLLAPEIGTGNGRSENLSDLAAMMGIRISSNSGANVDAIYPEIYPQVLGSTPFLTGLFDIKVCTQDHRLSNIRYYDYMKNHQRNTWWSKIIGTIKGLFTFKKADAASGKANSSVNIFQLTKEQSDIADAIEGCIGCSVDRKTSVVNITVVQQDPLVAATIADSVQQKLKSYVIQYRTAKARNDVEYLQNLVSEAEKRYVQARQRYNSFSDSNSELALPSYINKQNEMENDMQLRFNTYTQVRQQLQLAQDRLREQTPAFVQIQPATVPLKKDGPKRLTILLTFFFFAFVITSIYILAHNHDNTPQT